MARVEGFRVKVLVFTSQFCHGGAERLGAELAIDLNKRGVHADVMGMYTEKMDRSSEAKSELLRRGVPSVHFLGLEPHPSFLQVIKGVLKLNALIRRQGYDIVETSSLTPGIIASCSRFGTSARHVAGIHYSFGRDGRESLSRRIFLAATHIPPETHFYAVSDFVRKTWMEYSRAHARRTRTIYNSIGCREGRSGGSRQKMRGELGLSEDTRIVLCIGRLAAYKRQDLVVEALGPECEPENLAILFVGEEDALVAGTQEMLARVREEIRRLAIGSRVRFLGLRSDIRELMASADLLVHATEKEAFGLVLAEALAEGLPVVSTGVEGIPEVLQGTDSTMVPPGDAAALRRAALAALSRSPEEAGRVRSRGEEQAARFSQSKRTSRMLEFFEDMLSDRP